MKVSPPKVEKVVKLPSIPIKRNNRNSGVMACLVCMMVSMKPINRQPVKLTAKVPSGKSTEGKILWVSPVAAYLKIEPQKPPNPTNKTFII